MSGTKRKVFGGGIQSEGWLGSDPWNTPVSHFVKGCRMPALNHRPLKMQQNAAGRYRTSLEGRNRVMLPLRVRAGDGLWGFELSLCHLT